MTAPHHPRAPVHRGHRLAAAAPCLPAGGGPGALRTFASPGPDDLFTSPSGGPGSGPSFGLPPLQGTTGDYRSPSTPTSSTPGGLVPLTDTPVTPITPTPAVPEPLAWILMLSGVGIVGSALRHLRRPVQARRGAVLVRAGLVADLVATPFESLGAAARTAVTASGQGAAESAAVGAKSTKAALLAKAALCVCPPALLATSVATVPPVRHAVYAATAPRALRPATAAPCDPGITVIDPHAPAGQPAETVVAPATSVPVPDPVDTAPDRDAPERAPIAAAGTGDASLAALGQPAATPAPESANAATAGTD